MTSLCRSLLAIRLCFRKWFGVVTNDVITATTKRYCVTGTVSDGWMIASNVDGVNRGWTACCGIFSSRFRGQLTLSEVSFITLKIFLWPLLSFVVCIKCLAKFDYFWEIIWLRVASIMLGALWRPSAGPGHLLRATISI